MHERSLRRLLLAAAFFALALGASVGVQPAEVEAGNCWNCQLSQCVSMATGAKNCIQGDGWCYLDVPCNL